MHTFYWYDYETTGISAKIDRVTQFAGIRTDANLNIIDEHMYYCKPTYDSLPDPRAVAVTGITPQKCEKDGLIEHEFFKKINNQFALQNTCIVGYNNIRFDDEFSRYGFFRNFIDPYAWHWKNNNNRWDIIDIVRAAYALKKDASLNWVYDDNSNPKFKLEYLSVANDIEHSDAHDALADVRATIALAKIIKTKQAKLFDYAFSLRNKHTVHKKIKLFTPMLHTSVMYPASLSCTKMVSPVCYHPNYADRVIVFDLQQDPQILLDKDLENLKYLTFTKKDDLAKTNDSRLEIKEIVFNKTPIFVPDIYKLEPKIAAQLKIDIDLCLKNLAFIEKNKEKIEQITRSIYLLDKKIQLTADADQSLYDNFIDNADRRICEKIQQLKSTEIAKFQPNFKDEKLRSLFLNFKARNYPNSLSNSELNDWRDIVNKRLIKGENGYLSFADFEKILQSCIEQIPDKKNIWDSLKKYANSILN